MTITAKLFRARHQNRFRQWDSNLSLDRMGLAKWLVDDDHPPSRPSRSQSFLATVVWCWIGQDLRRLWFSRRVAFASGVARLPRQKVYRKRLGCEAVDASNGVKRNVPAAFGSREAIPLNVTQRIGGLPEVHGFAWKPRCCETRRYLSLGCWMKPCMGAALNLLSRRGFGSRWHFQELPNRIDLSAIRDQRRFVEVSIPIGSVPTRRPR